MQINGAMNKHPRFDRRDVLAWLVVAWCLFFAVLLGVPPDPDTFLDQDTRPSSASTFSDRVQLVSLGHREIMRSKSSKDRKALGTPQHDPPVALTCDASVVRVARAAMPEVAACDGLNPASIAFAFDPRGPPIGALRAGIQHAPA